METKEDVKIEMPDDDKQYTICCSHSSVGFIKYSSAFVIFLGILTCSFIMIGLHPGCRQYNIFYFNFSHNDFIYKSP